MKFSSLLLMAVAAFSPVLRGQSGTASFLELGHRAQQEQASGDFAGAQRDYKAALRLQPQSVESQINLGIVQYEMKNYDGSAATLEQVIKIRQDQFVPYLFLGLDRLGLHEPAMAIGSLQKAQALNASDPQVLLALARALAGSGNYEESVGWYGRAAKLNPTDSGILFETGMAYLNSVEQLSRHLLEVAPKNNPFVRVLYGDALMDQHRYHEALQVYAATPGDDATHAQLCLGARSGFALYGAGQTDEARQAWAAEQKSRQGCALALIGEAAASEDDQQALVNLQRLHGTDTPLSAASAHEIEWAVGVLPPAASTRLLGLLTSAQVLERDEGGQAGVCNQDLYPSQPVPPVPAHDANRSSGSERKEYGAWGCRMGAHAQGTDALTLLRAGRIADAAQCAASALARTPSDLELLFWSIRIDELLAARALQEFRASAPEAPKTHLLLGDMERERRHFSEAEQQYKRVLETQPDNLAAWQGLAVAEFQDGKSDESMEAARHVLAAEPENVTMNELLGEVLVAGRRFADAQAPLRKCLAKPQGDVARVHALLGRSEAGLGHTSAAITDLQLGASSDTDGSLHFQLSRLYKQAGDLEAARKAAALSENLAKQRRERATLETLDSGSVHEAAQTQP